MNDLKLDKEEIQEIIFFGLGENGVDLNSIDCNDVNKIIVVYNLLCSHFKQSYLSVGELDTFKEAACLMLAINKHCLVDDKVVNASVAVDAAYKMCEKPYYNIGENYDIPKKLDEVNFKEVFENNMETYNNLKNMLVNSLVYEDSCPLNYNLNLELFYKTALLYQKKNVIEDEIEVGEYQKENLKILKRTRKKIVSLFKK